MRTKDGRELPALATFDCHKTVHAGKIKFVQTNGARQHIVVEDCKGASHTIHVQHDFFGRGTPQVGDYYVVYDLGEHESWSPARTFLGGYTRIDERKEA